MIAPYTFLLSAGYLRIEGCIVVWIYGDNAHVGWMDAFKRREEIKDFAFARFSLFCIFVGM